MVSKLVGLSLVGVCLVHCSELDWVRECAAGHVMCEPARTEDLCHWPAVLRSVCSIGERLACTELPNISFLFPSFMVAIIPVFPLQCHIRVYCLVCVMHMLKSGYWFLCIVCVLYILLLLMFPIVLHMNCSKCYLSLMIQYNFSRRTLASIIRKIFRFFHFKFQYSCWCITYVKIPTNAFWFYGCDFNAQRSHTFTFMLPCIVTDFFLNSQPDIPIVHIYSVIKLHVSGILSAHHHEISTAHSALIGFMQVSVDRFQARKGWNSSWLCLETVIKNLHETYQCRTYSRELLMMGREDAQNM